jgi:hypothetical protein
VSRRAGSWVLDPTANKPVLKILADGKTIMKAEKAFLVIGRKLEKEYKRLGFKYSRKYKLLRKRTKKFEYYIFFSSFFEYIPGTCTELRVDLIINDRILLKTNIYADIELLHIKLWEMGSHYNIANETLIHKAFVDLKDKIGTCLIPQIKRLEEEAILKLQF